MQSLVTGESHFAVCGFRVDRNRAVPRPVLFSPNPRRTGAALTETEATAHALHMFLRHTDSPYAAIRREHSAPLAKLIEDAAGLAEYGAVSDG